jgi:uncharacterized protein YndB with AHSA1/START domain
MTRDLSITRFIPAPLEVVFRIWTDPEHLKKWWGPKDVTCTHAEVDLRVGGAYRIANQFPDGGVTWIQGVFQVIDPPHRLQYTWHLGESKPSSETETEVVTVLFTPEPTGTTLTITHQNAPDTSFDGHMAGWIGCLDGLEEYVANAQM